MIFRPAEIFLRPVADPYAAPNTAMAAAMPLASLSARACSDAPEGLPNASTRVFQKGRLSLLLGGNMAIVKSLPPPRLVCANPFTLTGGTGSLNIELGLSFPANTPECLAFSATASPDCLPKTCRSRILTVSNLSFGLTFGCFLFSISLAAPAQTSDPSPCAASKSLPWISILRPDAVAPGSGQFQLWVTGANVGSESVVRWNGKALRTSFSGAGKLRATVPAALVRSTGTAAITVEKCGAGNNISNTLYLPVSSSSSSVSVKRSSVGSGNVTSVVAADFNGDGKIDLASSNLSIDSVDVALGIGDGTFGPATSYPAGQQPLGIATGDFNHDGVLDLVVADQFEGHAGTVSVLLGKGDGTFLPQKTYFAGLNPITAAVGDFNGDGNLDIVTANQSSSNVSLLLGNGDGTFRTVRHFNTGNGTYGLAIGDFNEDGKLDVVTANLDGTVSVLLNNGHGFSPQQAFPTGAYSSAVVVADVNGDGHLDLITSNQVGNSVSVLLGDGKGGFGANTDFPAGSRPTGVAVADLNADGNPDLIVADSGDGTVSVLLGKGDGMFQSTANFLGSSYPTNVAIADFNGDGRLDFATGNGSTAVFLQTSK